MNSGRISSLRCVFQPAPSKDETLLDLQAMQQDNRAGPRHVFTDICNAVYASHLVEAFPGDEDVAAAFCGLIEAISTHCVPGARVIVMSGALKTLLVCLATHSTVPFIQERAAACAKRAAEVHPIAGLCV